MPVRDPRFGAAVAVTEAITGQSMSEDELEPNALRQAGRGETRVVFPMDAWDELEYLVEADEDDVEPWRDLPNKFLVAWKDTHGRDAGGEDDISCEGEEEDTEWAFYCRGFTPREVLQIVEDAIPDGWTAGIVPVPENAFSEAQIAISRR